MFHEKNKKLLSASKISALVFLPKSSSRKVVIKETILHTFSYKNKVEELCYLDSYIHLVKLNKIIFLHNLISLS